MINDYLKKQWDIIEHTTKVISIKNLVKEISFVFVPNKGFDVLMDITNKFFESQENALFVNDNQVIDKRTLSGRDISDVERLNKILRDEYFIMNADRTSLLLYLDKTNIEIADKIPPYETGLTERKQISLPDRLFKSFYLSCIRWAQIINSNAKKARLIWQYLNDAEGPCTVYDIYSDLCGALLDLSINETNKILYGYENFVQLSNGYWTVKTDKNNINREIRVSNILYKHLRSQQLYCLLEMYIEKIFKKQKFILADNAIRDLELINMHVARTDIEELFIKLELVELVPGRWTRKEAGVSVTKFSLTDLWNDTYKNVENIIKNQRDIKIFIGRIIEENETLEQMGNRMGITRERVRQIEKKIRNRITHVENSKIIRPFYEWFRNKLIIEKIVDLGEIGIEKQEFEIFDIITRRYFNNEEIYRILDGIIIHRPEYERLLKKIKKLSLDKKVINLGEIPLHGGLTKKIKLYDKIFTEIMNMVKLDENEYFYSGGKPTNEEEIFIVVYKSGKPLHFTEVPEQAKKLDLPLGTKGKRNILATMQRNNLLRRVAPGTYALKEWDIPKHIFITDLIYKVLKDADRPMYGDEIYSEVRKNRVDEIKERSVQYYLACHEEIICIYTKQYILKEWVETPEKLTKHGIDINKVEGGIPYNNKVILDVFRKGNSYITKYRLSEASFVATTLRISRYIELDLESHMVIIDKYDNFHFHSCGYETISGINRWRYITVNDVFYIEFINERIARLLTAEEFDEFAPIGNILLAKAENFWDKRMGEWDEQETEDKEVTEEIETVEDLISFGLEKGYVYYEIIEKLVDKGHNHWSILRELQDRDIVVNF